MKTEKVSNELDKTLYRRVLGNWTGTRTEITVTRETNGYAVWRSSQQHPVIEGDECMDGSELSGWFRHREDAIEYAVAMVGVGGGK